MHISPEEKTSEATVGVRLAATGGGGGSVYLARCWIATPMTERLWVPFLAGAVGNIFSQGFIFCADS